MHQRHSLDLPATLRKEVMASLFGANSAQGKFVPFVNQRDSIGRIILGPNLDKTLNRARKIVKKHLLEAHNQNRKSFFKLQQLRPRQKEEGRIHFNKLVKNVHQNSRESMHSHQGKLLAKSTADQIRLFYDRGNYQKFYHKKAPSVIMTLKPKEACKSRQEGSLDDSTVRKGRQEALPADRKDELSKEHIEAYFKEESRRKQHLGRLQFKLYPEVESELRRIDSKFTLLKNQAISLKNQTNNIKQSVN